MSKSYIDDGTASVTSGDTTITFAGVSVVLFKQNDRYIQGGKVGIIESVNAGANTVELSQDWPGDTAANAAYSVVPGVSDEELAASTRTLMQYISGPLLTIAAMTGDDFPANGKLLISQDGDWATVASTGSDEIVRKTSPTISAPTISGHPTIEGVTSTGATGTGKTVFSASPTFTGTVSADEIHVGGSGGSAQITAKGASPATSLLQTGIVEWIEYINGSAIKVLGTADFPNLFYWLGGPKFGVGGSNGSGMIYAQSSTTPSISILKTGVREAHLSLNYSTLSLDVVNGDTGGVSLGGGATSWSSLSDFGAKRDLVPIVDALEKVASLRTVTGAYNTDEEGMRRAFLIAQDVLVVQPEAVTAADNGTLYLSYTETIPLAFAAIKELIAQIQACESRLTSLEG